MVELVALYDDEGRPAGTADRARVRAENLRHAATGVVVRNARGEVYVTEPHGREQTVDVRVGGEVMRVIAPVDVRADIGQAVGLRFDPGKVHLFHAENGTRLL